MEQVAVVFGAQTLHEEDIQEFKELVAACDMEIVQEFRQVLRQIHGNTWIGKGKCAEIHTFLQAHALDAVLFFNDLSPLQIRNLEAYWNINVMDRSDLILEIFARRAKSKAARLQIENAQLKRQRSRLIGSKKHLGRQSASGQNKGLGEKQLELDRRRIASRIVSTTRELKQLEKTRMTQRNARLQSRLPLVSLIGYTNAGKSTIMNALLQYSNSSNEKYVYEKDMLFATLDTSLRRIELGHQSFLLSDTVGFVRDLPHELIEAFHSTLEEACYADLLIEVIDTSYADYEQQMKVTSDTLQALHIGNLPILHVFNKCDQTDIPYPSMHGEHLFISAKNKECIEELINQIRLRLFPPTTMVKLCIPYEKSSLYGRLLTQAQILQRDDFEDGIHLEVALPNDLLETYKAYMH
ncbi:GTPase HflX [Amedibacillus dolichus]|uniref:GTPase HflX n=1 Tax=Amedibacillus dolichus TaxID=31971 RepID=UPI002E7948A5|nr:GTPase HflX [Amedibacillus dolichus]MEE0384468.1 GTPase HflX [Amedibacillus dolichus]